MMSKWAERIWPAIRAHVRYYGDISYSGLPHYVSEWLDAGLLVEKSSKGNRTTYVLGVLQ